MSSAQRTPVRVGIGTAMQREDDFRLALEPVDLMLKAAQAAGANSGSAHALRAVQFIALTRGRWRYANPACELARHIGAQATTLLADVGVLQSKA